MAAFARWNRASESERLATPPPTSPRQHHPFGTNVGSAASRASRTTFLVIDDSTFRPGNEGLMKRSIDEFLVILPPTERVALMTTPLASVRTEATTPTEVRQALERVHGNASRVQTPNEVACRTRETLESMQGLLSSLARRAHAANRHLLFDGTLGNDADDGKARHVAVRSLD